MVGLFRTIEYLLCSLSVHCNFLCTAQLLTKYYIEMNIILSWILSLACQNGVDRCVCLSFKIEKYVQHMNIYKCTSYCVGCVWHGLAEKWMKAYVCML
jgi:hypothetical protein